MGQNKRDKRESAHRGLGTKYHEQPVDVHHEYRRTHSARSGGGGFVAGTRKINTDGQWHHVACVFPNDGTPDVTDVQLYVDGASDAISASTASAVNTTANGDVKIGSDVQSRFWNGAIDDVRIYPRALTAVEIAGLAAETNSAALAWHRRYLGNAPIDWLADDDGDRFSRLLEYALGGQPQWQESALVAPPFIADDHFRWTVPRRRAGTHNITYTAEASRNLVDWNVPVSLFETVPLGAEFDSATYQAAPAVSTEPKLFFRLRTTQP